MIVVCFCFGKNTLSLCSVFLHSFTCAATKIHSEVLLTCGLSALQLLHQNHIANTWSCGVWLRLYPLSCVHWWTVDVSLRMWTGCFSLWPVGGQIWAQICWRSWFYPFIGSFISKFKIFFLGQSVFDRAWLHIEALRTKVIYRACLFVFYYWTDIKRICCWSHESHWFSFPQQRHFSSKCFLTSLTRHSWCITQMCHHFLSLRSAPQWPVKPWIKDTNWLLSPGPFFSQLQLCIRPRSWVRWLSPVSEHL